MNLLRINVCNCETCTSVNECVWLNITFNLTVRIVMNLIMSYRSCTTSFFSLLRTYWTFRKFHKFESVISRKLRVCSRGFRVKSIAKHLHFVYDTGYNLTKFQSISVRNFMICLEIGDKHKLNYTVTGSILWTVYFLYQYIDR